MKKIILITMLMSAVFAQSDKDPLVLMGDAQAIIKDISSVFSEPMTAKEAFERVEGSGTIFLNKMRIELHETLKISDLANFNIIGNGATLVAKIDMPIITFRDVMNVSIHGLKVVHEIGANCSQNCIEFYNSSNIRIDKCDFDGSGFIGLALNKTVSATIKNNRFYNCTFGIAAWNSRLITVKDNSFSDNRNQDIMTNDLSQYNNDWKAENIFGALVDYSAIKDVHHYICFNGDDNSMVIWVSYSREEKALEVKYKGQDKAMQLVHTKGDSRFPGAYVVSDDYYIEMVDGKENGQYRITNSGIWVYVEYKRGTDGKIFRFTIDHDANPYGKAPCF